MEWIFFIGVLYIFFIFLKFLFKSAPSSSRSRRTSERSGTRAAPQITIAVSSPQRYTPIYVKVSPDKAAQDADRLWVGQNTPVKIGPYSIPKGFLYVGAELSAVSGWRGTEPALINPKMRIAHSNPDYLGGGMDYWPSYSDIPPECRAAYLEWLSSGRNDPDAYIGYVFLYFYGMERRVLAEARYLDSARKEVSAIVAEVERLSRIYSRNNSFSSYSSSFLQAAKLLYPQGSIISQSPTYAAASYEFPLDVRIRLAQFAKEGQPIPAEWALAWYVGNPEIRLRTPARRCFEEFKQLFMDRYSNEYPQGLLIKPNKTKVKLEYKPASASFGGSIEIPVGDLPDVVILKSPFSKVQRIADTCVAEIEPYSRFVGKNPEEANSLAALSFLPKELISRRESEKVKAFRQWLLAQVSGKRHAVLSGSDIMRHWEPESADRMSKQDAVAFVHVLEAFGFGIEPDVRFGGSPVDNKSKVVVFPQQDAPPKAPSPSYSAASLLLQLAAAVAASDGTIEEAEEKHLEEHLASALHLAQAETQRLSAHLRWLLESKPSLTGTKKRLEGIDEATRQSIGQFCITVAGADGQIEPTEVKTLGKIYKVLGLDPENLYGDIHTLVTSGDASAPVTIKPAMPTEAGFKVPAPPEKGRIELNVERIEKIIRDTKDISEHLSTIFKEDEEEIGAPVRTQPPTAPSGVSVISGLDTAHTKVLHALAAKGSWSRAEFEDMVAKENLFADGTYEAINEAALDKCGSPVLEGEDPVELNRDVLKELLA